MKRLILFSLMTCVIFTGCVHFSVANTQDYTHDNNPGVYLADLSNDELMKLYAPFMQITDDFNARYGLEVMHPCIFTEHGRDAIIRTIMYETIESFTVSTVELFELLKSAVSLNLIRERITHDESTGAISSERGSMIREAVEAIVGNPTKLNYAASLLEEGMDLVDVLDSIVAMEGLLPPHKHHRR